MILLLSANIACFTKSETEIHKNIPGFQIFSPNAGNLKKEKRKGDKKEHYLTEKL